MSHSLWHDQPISYPTVPLPRDGAVDVAVVGGGFTGLIAALLLARRGQRVAVLEGRTLGAGASGATTAKATVLQGTRLANLFEAHGIATAGTYLDANAHGLRWLREFCADAGVATEEATAVTFASTAKGATKVTNEHRVHRALGLASELTDTLDVPFPVTAAVTLPGQLQLDPMKLVEALARAVVAAGGTITEHARVRDLSPHATSVTVSTDAGDLTAGQVVVATATPILDHRLLTASLVPQRSYLCAFDGAPDVPEGMYLSAESPTISVRGAKVAGRDKLLVGGQGHRTGLARSTREKIADLERWARKYFPSAELSHAWSAQDYHPIDMLPVVRPVSWGRGRIQFAGGYSKWGMTGAPAAAEIVADLIQGIDPALSFGTPSVWGTAKTAARQQEGAPLAIAENFVRAELGGTDPDPGETGRSGLTPVGESIVDGRPCRLSLVCPHLGATLAYNDAEGTWDCPWHGSRFAADGTVLEGPAVADLKRL